MYKKVISLIEKIIFYEIRAIPCELRKDFFEEITETNYKRTKPICFSACFLFTAIIILEYTTLGRMDKEPEIISKIISLQYAGLIFSLVFSLVFLFLYQNLSIWVKRILNALYLLLSIVLCELISINTYNLYGQILPIIICMLTISSIYIFNDLMRIPFFSFALISFIMLLRLSKIRPDHASGFFIVILVTFVFSLFQSKLRFNIFIEQYINRRIIINNIKEIGRLNADLEAKIQERSEAITKANAQIELEKLHVSFFTNLSHEFRTPINVILAAQQLLDLKLKKTLPSKDFLSVSRNLLSIEQNAYRLMRLSSNLIDITRIDSGCFVLNPVNVNIIKVTEEIVTAVSAFLRPKGIRVTFETSVDKIITAIDVSKIERALLNILSNAVKFSPQNSTITVKVCSECNVVHISIKDMGIGIPSNMRDVIFNRFVQVDNSLTRDREGSGLGLSIVKSIVELHNGSISVNSDLYSGSEFVISLPVQMINENASVQHYSFEGQASLDILKVEFSDIDT